jgi:DNA-binding NtrC family response regulator
MFALPKGNPAAAPAGPDSLQTLAELEKDYIRKALEICHKNHTEAARRLGISRSTLWRKLKEHGIEDATAAASEAGASDASPGSQTPVLSAGEA